MGPFNYLSWDGKNRSRYSIYILSLIFLKVNVVVYFISQYAGSKMSAHRIIDLYNNIVGPTLGGSFHIDLYNKI